VAAQFSSKTVIIIAGPTAVGKTDTAIAIAKHFSTEIISADSRQCFKELNIGVARPSQDELAMVPHHFIASHSIQQEVTAATFESYAFEIVNHLFAKQNVVVMAGGTGLYIKVFCEGLDAIPAIDTAVRNAIISNYESNGLAWLQQQVQQKDPVYFTNGEIQNPQRMMRALEVVESTGLSILSFQKKEKTQRNFNIIKIGIELPKEQLHQRIHQRVDAMMENGLLDEVKSLHSFRQLNALQTVGYAELFDFLNGNISLAKAIEEIKTHTRQYAKRQMTWFKKDSSVKWFAPGQVQQMIDFVNGLLTV
jgi:tRNA dimethylallyltransferase